jgi:hypothetical protein
MSTGTRIILKKGSGEPDPSDLEVAELAVDVVNGDLYTKLSDGEVHQLNDGAGQGGGLGNIDGGNASSIYTLGQIIEGGSA